jgi:cytochrome c biogenesis protein CcmG/thiol:disulfide interchange protein DsbE
MSSGLLTASKPVADDEVGPQRKMRRRTTLAIFMIVGFTLVLGAVFGSRFGKDPRLVESPLIGKPAPDAVLPYLEQDGELTLSELRGQIVVLNFWASWCLSCRFEHDDLLATAMAYASKDVQFIGVDFQDEKDDAIAFLNELGRGYPNVVDVDSRLGVELGVYGIPETFFIDREGIVVAKISGESNANALGAVLDDILAGREPGSLKTGSIQPAPDD